VAGAGCGHYLACASPVKATVKELAAAISSAAAPGDIPVKDRNRLYAALNRSMDRPGVPGGVLAAWAAAANEKDGKFLFLKKWIADPTFGFVKAFEKQSSAKQTFNGGEYVWATKMDAQNMYANVEGGKEYAEKLIANARQSKPHPDFPKDKTMRMYRILAKLSDGFMNKNTTERGYQAEAEVTDKAGGEALLAAVERQAKGSKGKTRCSSDSEDDEAAEKKKNKAAAAKRKREEAAAAAAKTEGDGQEEAQPTTPKPPVKKAKTKKTGKATPLEDLAHEIRTKILEVKKTLASLKKNTAVRHAKSLESALVACLGPLEELGQQVEDAIVGEANKETVKRLQQDAAPAFASADEEIAFAEVRLKKVVA